MELAPRSFLIRKEIQEGWESTGVRNTTMLKIGTGTECGFWERGMNVLCYNPEVSGREGLKVGVRKD